MLQVTVKTNNGIKEFTGVIGCVVGQSAIQLIFYGDIPHKKYIPLHRILEIDERALTDEEIENCGDEGFINWYNEQKAKYEAQKEAEVKDNVTSIK